MVDNSANSTQKDTWPGYQTCNILSVRKKAVGGNEEGLTGLCTADLVPSRIVLFFKSII